MTIQVQKLVELTDLFPKEDFKDRIDYIKDYDKKQLLQVLASINCYPSKVINPKYSAQDHWDILWFLFTCDYHTKAWGNVFLNLTARKYFPPVFHRAANLVAIEEILNK